MSLFAVLTVRLIEGYQSVLSPLLPRACRFFPSCSEYAKQAISERGLFHGAGLAAWRICRCQPFSLGGVDLPPQPSTDPVKSEMPAA